MLIFIDVSFGTSDENMTEEEKEMMNIMGFHSFGTTKVRQNCFRVSVTVADSTVFSDFLIFEACVVYLPSRLASGCWFGMRHFCIWHRLSSGLCSAMLVVYLVLPHH